MKSEFIETIANTEVGRSLIQYLQEVDTHYADIRNLDGVPAEVRVEALRILKEALLDKLLVMRGELDRPDLNEHL